MSIPRSSAPVSANDVATSSTRPMAATIGSNFPISSDHRMTLILFNVHRATHLNLSLLAPYASKSTSDLPPLNPPLFQRPAALPPSLVPTELQRTVKHPAWIDAVPLPQMRENFILALGKFHYDSLCADLLRGGADDHVEHQGVMVWADPWDIKGWEITESFAKKWGFMLKGCDELFEASNSWRKGRGEEALVMELGNMSIA